MNPKLMPNLALAQISRSNDLPQLIWHRKALEIESKPYLKIQVRYVSKVKFNFTNSYWSLLKYNI